MNKIRPILLFVPVALLPFTAAAVTGVCTSADRGTTVSIKTTDQGQVIDLTVTAGKAGSTSFPEAKAGRVALPSYGFSFSAKETPLHDALAVDIYGSSGQIKYGGNSTMVDCDWTPN